MLRLYRVTLEMPEMDSTGQSAPIRVSLTSSWLKGAPYWPSIEVYPLLKCCFQPSKTTMECACAWLLFSTQSPKIVIINNYIHIYIYAKWRRRVR